MGLAGKGRNGKDASGGREGMIPSRTLLDGKPWDGCAVGANLFSVQGVRGA